MIIKRGEPQTTSNCESLSFGNPENTPRSLNTTGRQITHQQSVPLVSAGPSTYRYAKKMNRCSQRSIKIITGIRPFNWASATLL